MPLKPSVTVIIPVYNEDESVLKKIIQSFSYYKLPYFVVDDGSDIPVSSAHLVKPKNKGYGAAIKSALYKVKTDYVAIIDSDTQYDPVDLVELIESLDDEDMLIGRRITLEGGLRRVLGRFGMNVLATICSGHICKDLNSGLRIFKRNIAKSYISLLCDEFSFTASLTMCMLIEKYKVRWVNIGYYPRVGAKSTVKILRHGLITLYQILMITVGLRTRNLRKWLRGECTQKHTKKQTK